MIDEASDLLTVHHKGHRDQHEPQAQDKRQASSEHEHGDHVVKIVCVDHQPSGLTAKPQLNKIIRRQIHQQLITPFVREKVNYAWALSTVI